MKNSDDPYRCPYTVDWVLEHDSQALQLTLIDVPTQRREADVVVDYDETVANAGELPADSSETHTHEQAE